MVLPERVPATEHAENAEKDKAASVMRYNLLLQRLQESQVLSRFDRLLAKMAQLNAAYNEAEVEADLRAAESEPGAAQ